MTTMIASDSSTRPLARNTPAEPPRPEQRDDRPPVQRVLMLTHRAPYPPDRGDRIRSHHLLRTLSHHFDVSLACTTDEPTWIQYHQVLSEHAKQIALEPISPGYSNFKGALALATGRPITPACFYRRSLANTILQWHQARPFDAVLTFCTGMIDYARLIMAHSRVKPRHVLDLVDVDSAKWDSYAADTTGLMKRVYATEARRLRAIESGNRDHFDYITVVSDRERDTYQNTVGRHEGLRVVSNGVDLDYFVPQPLPNDGDARTIVFVGVLNYKPNADGVVWFANEVMPLLQQRVPDARFKIVGRSPTPRVLELNQRPGVEVVGSVPDVRDYLREASVVVAPLQIARGVQNKILEAMACSRPVVASPEAGDGVQAEDGRHFYIARNPQEWVQRIEHLLSDRALSHRIGTAARQLVQRRYNWENQLHPMVDLLRGVESVV